MRKAEDMRVMWFLRIYLRRSRNIDAEVTALCRAVDGEIAIRSSNLLDFEHNRLGTKPPVEEGLIQDLIKPA